MPKLEIDEVFPRTDFYPMIVNFRNGYPSDDFNEKCLVLQNRRTKEISVAAELGGLVYYGDEQKSDIGKTLLLARNKHTGKVRLIEVGYAELSPQIKMDMDSTENMDTSHLELSRKFGSKKNRKMAEQREKLKVNVETVTKQMHNVTQTVSEDKLDISMYNNEDEDEFYIPERHTTATKPEDVYKIDYMLPEELYQNIYSELEDKDYLSQLSPWIRDIVSTKTNPKHIVLGVFAHVLLQMCKTLTKDIIKKKFTPCPQSPTLGGIVLKNFLLNVNGRYLKPNSYRDKMVCHAIVYLLLINDLKINLEEFCTGAKIATTTAIMKARVTGANIATVGSKKMIQLKLPLATRPPRRRKSAKF